MRLRRTQHAGALLLTAALCLASGCGLPDARPDLPPPSPRPASVTAEKFAVGVPESTASPFLGIEVYYRFAEVGSASARDLEARADLTAAGFRRVASSSDRYPRPDLPLIDGPGAGVEVTLDFSAVDIGQDPTAAFRDRDGNARSVSLRRALHEDDGRYKGFACDQFAEGDADIGTVAEQLADADDCETVQLQLYALSYGGTESLTVYSDAVDLGTINLTFGR